MFKFLLYKVGEFIVNILPLSWAYGFAEFFSRCQYRFSFRDRRAVENNLKVITRSQTVPPQMTEAIFVNFGRYLVEFFRMIRKVDDEYIQKNVKIEHLEYAKEAFKHGKGGIIVTSHLGNWELGALLVSRLLKPLLIIALPHKERWVNRLFNAQREACGQTVVQIHVSVRRCLERLKENGLIGLVADRDFLNNGEVLEFLGRPTIMPKGPALFSIKTGAPIIPCFVVRNPDNTFTLSFERPIYPPQIMDQDISPESLKGLMRKYIVLFEEKIRQHPTQWLMFREFWIK